MHLFIVALKMGSDCMLSVEIKTNLTFFIFGSLYLLFRHFRVEINGFSLLFLLIFVKFYNFFCSIYFLFFKYLLTHH